MSHSMQDPSHTILSSSTLTRDSRRWLDAQTDPDHKNTVQRPKGFRKVALVPTYKEIRVEVPAGYFCSAATGLFKASSLTSLSAKQNPSGTVNIGGPVWVEPGNPLFDTFATGALCVRPMQDTGGNTVNVNPFNVDLDTLIADQSTGAAPWPTNGSAASTEPCTQYPFWAIGLEDLTNCRVRTNGTYLRVQVVAQKMEQAWDGTALYFTDAAAATANSIADLQIHAVNMEKFTSESSKYASGCKVRHAGLYDEFREPGYCSYSTAYGDQVPGDLDPTSDGTTKVVGVAGNAWGSINPDFEGLDERAMVIIRNGGTEPITIIATIVMNLEVTGAGTLSQYSPCFPKYQALPPDTFFDVAKHLSLHSHPLIVGPDSFFSFIEKHAMPILKSIAAPIAGALFGPEAALAAPALIGFIDSAIHGSKPKTSSVAKPAPKQAPPKRTTAPRPVRPAKTKPKVRVSKR